MTESGVKVVMDPRGLTISGGEFSLTTSGSQPSGLETVVSQLQAMARGTYGQYCALSRALEAVGERWGMLIVRDLLISAKSTSELQRGLPAATPELLSLRLREMAYSGVVEKDETTDPDGGVRYRLTEHGRRLEDILLALSRWGSVMLARKRPDEVITESAMMTAMRATFVPETAVGRSERFELHFGDIVIHVIVDDGTLEVGRGPLDGAPVIDAGPLFKDMLSRRVSVSDALASGKVHVDGDPGALDIFISMFDLPDYAAPKPSAI
jgi:DNA-binding HxlR family transcriptional regulator